MPELRSEILNLQVQPCQFSGRSGLAARSIACVQAVAAAGGVWVAFPSAPCPAGLVPSAQASRCFSGFGSGTWASAALAVGLGLSVLVWAPFGVPAAWGFAALGGPLFLSQLAQLSLLA